MGLLDLLLNEREILDLSGASLTPLELRYLSDSLKINTSLKVIRMNDIPALHQVLVYFLQSLQSNRSVDCLSFDLPCSLKQPHLDALNNLHFRRPSLIIELAPGVHFGSGIAARLQSKVNLKKEQLIR